jgi:hypothetical protein
MNRKWVLGGIITSAWAVALGIAKVVLAPALGAATVMQLQGSDPSYVASMLFVSVLAIGSVLITLLFAFALYLVARSK